MTVAELLRIIETKFPTSGIRIGERDISFEEFIEELKELDPDSEYNTESLCYCHEDDGNGAGYTFCDEYGSCFWCDPEGF